MLKFEKSRLESLSSMDMRANKMNAFLRKMELFTKLVRIQISFAICIICTKCWCDFLKQSEH